MGGRAWRDVSHDDAEGAVRTAPAPLPPTAAATLALQRSAGNQAVASLLARQPATAAPPAALPAFPDPATDPGAWLKLVAFEAYGEKVTAKAADKKSLTLKYGWETYATPSRVSEPGEASFPDLQPPAEGGFFDWWEFLGDAAEKVSDWALARRDGQAPLLRHRGPRGRPGLDQHL